MSNGEVCIYQHRPHLLAGCNLRTILKFNFPFPRLIAKANQKKPDCPCYLPKAWRIYAFLKGISAKVRRQHSLVQDLILCPTTVIVTAKHASEADVGGMAEEGEPYHK